MVVEDAQTGYVGAVVRIEYGRMELEDRRGRRKPFPIGPGYLIDGKPVILTAPRRAAPAAPKPAPRRVRSRCRARRRRSRWPAGSTSRADTTPNSSSRCGATICASRVWSSNTSAASTISPPSSRSSSPGRAVGWACWSTIWSPVPRRPASPTAVRRGARRRAHTGRRPSVHRHLAGGQARAARHLGVAGRARAASTGSTACAKRWAGRTREQADIARAWQRIRGRVRDWNDLEPALIGRVEELIDFVTQCQS